MLDDKKSPLIEEFVQNFLSGGNYSDAFSSLAEIFTDIKCFEYKWCRFIRRNTANLEKAKLFLRQLQSNLVTILNSYITSTAPAPQLQCLSQYPELSNVPQLLVNIEFLEDGQLNCRGNPEVTLRKLKEVFTELYIFNGMFAGSIFEPADMAVDSEGDDDMSLPEPVDPDAECFVCGVKPSHVFCTDCQPNTTLFYFCNNCDEDFHCADKSSHIRRPIAPNPPTPDIFETLPSIWRCNSCRTHNPGMYKFCQSCGSLPGSSSVPPVQTTPNAVLMARELLSQGTRMRYPHKSLIYISQVQKKETVVSEREAEQWLNEVADGVDTVSDKPGICRREDVISFIESKSTQTLLTYDREQLCSMIFMFIQGQTDQIAKRYLPFLPVGEVRDLGLNKKTVFEHVNSAICRDLPHREEPPPQLDHLVEKLTALRALNKSHAVMLTIAEFNLPNARAAELLLHFVLDDEELHSILSTPALTFDDLREQVVIQHCRRSEQEAREVVRNVLLKECPLCYDFCAKTRFCFLISCDCEMCPQCFVRYFEDIVRNKSPPTWSCPVCSLPNMDNVFIQDKDSLLQQRESELQQHLINLTCIIDGRHILRELRPLFHSKLTAWRMSKDANFIWCAHGCGNGAIYDDNQLRVFCNGCNKYTCKGCRKIWEREHEGKTCEEFEAWKIMKDPHIAKLMQISGIECPNCHMRYELVRGGCLHFTCRQCRYEFCGGCNQKIYTHDACPYNCTNGLHSHHPRDCLYYLRDWDPAALEKLLTDNNVVLVTQAEGREKCGVRITDALDEAEQECGVACFKEDLCKKHYTEYLVNQVNKNHLDPATQMTLHELQITVKQARLSELPKNADEQDEPYRLRVLAYLQAKAPIVKPPAAPVPEE